MKPEAISCPPTSRACFWPTNGERAGRQDHNSTNMKTVVSTPSVTALQSKTVIGALLGSKIFRDYKSAFKDLTGMTITLRPLESWPLPRDASSAANPLCALPG